MTEKRTNLVGGLILIAIGLLALVGNFVDLIGLGDLAVFFMAGLGTLFLLWGILTRETGLIIPGGIISGIGWGIALVAGPFNWVSGDAEGGVFMLAFAAGWVAITLLTAVFTSKTHWWALIPGGIMALIGLAVLYGGLFANALTLLGSLWPVVLIILGVAILFGARKAQQGKQPEKVLE